MVGEGSWATLGSSCRCWLHVQAPGLSPTEQALGQEKQVMPRFPTESTFLKTVDRFLVKNKE